MKLCLEVKKNLSEFRNTILKEIGHPPCYILINVKADQIQGIQVLLGNLY
jgi:hypothetical protein